MSVSSRTRHGAHPGAPMAKAKAPRPKPVDAVQVEGEREGSVLYAVEGFYYRAYKKRKSTWYVECRRKGCSGLGKGSPGGRQLVLSKDRRCHNHGDDIAFLDIQQHRKKIVELCLQQRGVSAKAIFRNYIKT